MNSIIDLCFLCTKDYNCVSVDDNIMCQVKYILPEIINIKLDIPLRICFVCNNAIYAYSKFKQISVENILRLEARIKGSPGPLQHTGNPHIAASSETSHIKPDNIEQIIIKEEPTTRSPQLHTNRASPDPTPQLQTPGAPNIQQHTHTQQVIHEEEIFIKEEHLDETQDQVFDNNIYEEILKEKCDDSTNSQPEHETTNKMATLDTSENISENLDAHRKIHSEIKDFKCDSCSKSFTKNYDLLRHRKIHIGVKDFKCEICNKTFLHKYKLLLHMRTHSGTKDFQCKVCNKSFTYKFNLGAHMKIHSGIKEFQCEICNKLFLHKCSLVTHMKIHSGVKDFHCDVCNKSFTYKFHLVSHMKIHSGVKDFQCEICKKKFINKSHLVKHKKIHLKIKKKIINV